MLVRQIPKVLASFVLGLLVMLTGSLIYSKVQQHRSPLTVGGSAPPSAPAAPPHTAKAGNSGPVPVTSPEKQNGSKELSRNDPQPASKMGDTHSEDLPHGVAPEPSRPAGAVSGNVPAETGSAFKSGASAGSEAARNSERPAAPSIVSGPQITAARGLPYVPAGLRDLPAEYTQKSPVIAPQPASEKISSNAKPKTITLPPGTSLAVRLAEPLSSDRNRTGDTFRATLAAPVVIGGSVVAPEQSVVFGRVAQARRAPLLGGKSDLTLVLTNITEADGNVVRIDSSSFEEQGSRSNLVNTAKMATGAAVGAALGALSGAAEGAGISSSLRNDDRTNGFMATRRTVVLPAGTRIVFKLATPLTVTQLHPERGSE